VPVVGVFLVDKFKFSKPPYKEDYLEVLLSLLQLQVEGYLEHQQRSQPLVAVFLGQEQEWHLVKLNLRRLQEVGYLELDLRHLRAVPYLEEEVIHQLILQQLVEDCLGSLSKQQEEDYLELRQRLQVEICLVLLHKHMEFSQQQHHLLHRRLQAFSINHKILNLHFPKLKPSINLNNGKINKWSKTFNLQNSLPKERN
jgi:hypothetical protein